MWLYYVLSLALITGLHNGMVSSQQSNEGDNRRAAGLGPMTLGRYAAREDYIQEHGYPNKDRADARLVDNDSRMPMTVGQAAYGRAGDSKGPLTAARAASGLYNNRWD